MLMTEHNVWFYETLMADLRGAIGAGRVAGFAASFLKRYSSLSP
jgi:queuine tRNA-ribosyltransferase